MMYDAFDSSYNMYPGGHPSTMMGQYGGYMTQPHTYALQAMMAAGTMPYPQSAMSQTPHYPTAYGYSQNQVIYSLVYLFNTRKIFFFLCFTI